MIYSKNGINGIEKKFDISIIKDDSLNISKNSKNDLSKSFESHQEINSKIINKVSTPENSSRPKKNNILKTLHKSKTYCTVIGNNINNINNTKTKNLTFIKKYTKKSNTINSKSQSLMKSFNESFVRISNNHLNIESKWLSIPWKIINIYIFK